MMTNLTSRHARLLIEAAREALKEERQGTTIGSIDFSFQMQTNPIRINDSEVLSQLEKLEKVINQMPPEQPLGFALNIDLKHDKEEPFLKNVQSRFEKVMSLEAAPKKPLIAG